MKKHTETPWHYQEGADVYTHIIRTEDDRIVISLRQDSKGQSEADARHIVRCVNSHDALVEALQRQTTLMELVLGGMAESSELT